MAGPLKNLYSKVFVDELTTYLKRAYPALDTARFTKLIFDIQWAERELKERMKHIAFVLQQMLPDSLEQVTAIFINVIHQLRKNRNGEQYFEYMFFPEYFALFGQQELKISMNALEEITQFTSAEFAVRPFLINYPKEMKKQFLLWSKHKHPMVRRLASEGVRPRLPWAMGVPYLKTEPHQILPILENLKMDSSENVRRSVANNLNDISKDHPALVLEVVSAWKGGSPEMDKLIRHACRGLLKRGDKKILALFDFGTAQGIEVVSLTLEKKSVSLGEALNFSFQLKVASTSKLRIEYGIDYQKANGKQRRKIFKLSEGIFKKGDYSLATKQWMKDLTTRKHYFGEHGLAILVNGIEKASGSFLLRA